MNTNAQTINKVRNIVYVAINFTTGLTDLVLAVRKPDGSALSPAPTFTEQGNGVYTASYTPDTAGMWQELVTSATNGDKAIRAYTVVNYDVDDVAGAVATVDGNVDSIKTTVESNASKLDTIDGIVDSIQTDTDSIESKVDILDTNVDAIKAKTDNLPADTEAALEAISDKIDAIDAQVPTSGGYLL